MKKIALLLLLGLFMFSCKDSLKTVVDTQKEDKSMISTLEQSGVKLFKKEVVVFDESKTNSITLLVATRNNLELEKHFAKIKMSLTLDEEISESNVSNTNRPQLELLNKTEDGIFTEVVSKKFINNPKSYTIHFKLKDSNARKNSQLAGYTQSDWFTSSIGDNWARVTRSDMLQTVDDNSVNYEILKKANWYNGSYSLVISGYLYQGGNPSYAQANDNNAHRWGIRVRHNYWNYSVTCGN